MSGLPLYLIDSHFSLKLGRSLILRRLYLPNCPVGGSDRNDSIARKKHLTHQQTELGLSHMCTTWGLNPQWLDVQMIMSDNEISNLNTQILSGHLFVFNSVFFIMRHITYSPTTDHQLHTAPKSV